MGRGHVTPAVMKTAHNSYEREPAHRQPRTIAGAVGYVVVIATGVVAMTYPVAVAAVVVAAAIVVRARRRSIPGIRSIAFRPSSDPSPRDSVSNTGGRTTTN